MPLLTDHARHEAADLVGDLENVRHRGGIDQPVLHARKKKRRADIKQQRI